jgi:hypothetical protein
VRERHAGGIVAFGVEREGEDVVSAFEDAGGAVTLVHVAVDNEHPRDAVFVEQSLGGDGHVV